MSGVERDVVEEIEAAIHDWEVSPDAMRMRPEGFTADEVPVSLTISVDVGPFVAAMQDMARAVSRMSEKYGAWMVWNREAVTIALALSSAQRTTGPGRHGAVKHARDMRRAYLKKRARAV